MKTMVSVLTLSLFIGGCASQSPIRGSVVQRQFQEPSPGVGMPIVDFKLVDQSGNERLFREELADFTLVAFTRCDRDEHAQATKRLADLVAEYGDVKYVQVAGIDIHRSEAGCAQMESCHVNLASSELGSICDGSQAVHRKYGTGRDDWLYVIGPDRRVVLSSPIDQVDELREQLSVKVARYAAYKKDSLSSPPEDRVQ